MKFNRKAFFDGFRAKIDDTISQEQVDGLEFLLREIEKDPLWNDYRHIAYALATTGHETAWSFQPVEEGYYLGDKSRVKRFQKTLRYYPWIGRGYVQKTWEQNYKKSDKEIRAQKPEIVEQFEKDTGQTFDVANKPEQSLHPLIAYADLTLGMHQGWYTTKKLTDYINDIQKDYKNARKIINGLDKAGLIAGYAATFEDILRKAAKSANTSAAVPAANPPTAADTPAADPPNPPGIEQPPDNKPIETTVTRTEGDITVEASKPNEQDVNVPAAVGAPPSQGLFSKLSAGVGTLFGGTLLWQGLEKLGGIVFTPTAIAVVCFIVLIAFLGFCFWAWLDAWKQAQRTRVEAEAKTAINRKDIEWV